MSDAHLLAAAAGLGLGLSLIVAIGAQNAFVLRQGLRGEHVLAVVAVCALSDLVLIVAGVAGAGAALQAWPAALVVVRLAGALFLAGYAVLAARRALRPAADAALRTETGGTSTSLAAALATCLALTWLNPHVYLDTVVLLGSIASTHGEERWWFAAGAAAGSAIWFAALGFGARLLRPLFARPVAWRVLDAVIAVVMAALAVTLLLGL
ncbi:LysE/ArgO family amino acid transporter [Quadrisphaera oryzae]|uniref:LysE/ArgO family amino acid transporter n=1 Tax=Quadrisphaera TaxID=317661 RepID=UPI00351C8D9B